jgi:hypothetical protein
MARTDGEKNTEVKTSGTRGDKKISEHGIDPNQYRRPGQASSEVRSEPFTVDRDDRSWANSFGQRGQAVVGGIFNRLITTTRNQIEEFERRTLELKKELQDLEQLHRDFQEQIENPDT